MTNSAIGGPKMNKLLKIIVTLLLVSSLTLIVAGFAYSAGLTREQKMGQEQALAIERQVKFIEDPDLVERVERIGNEIAQVAKTVKVSASYGSDELSDYTYRFKIIKDKDVNAFSLPGGYIYLNKGLLDYAESDDQLAGVLAHEIAHAAHHHLAALMKKQASMDTYVALLTVVALLGDVKSHDLGNLIYGAQFVKIAKLNGYGQEAEMDADATAVRYLSMTSYSPVGLLTFLEKLAREKEAIVHNLGILQTHPSTRQRIAAIANLLTEMGIEFDRRGVLNAPTASVRENEADQSCEVIIDDDVVLRPAPVGALSSRDRAYEICSVINEMLTSGVELRELRMDSTNSTITGTNDKPILSIYQEDASYNAVNANDLLAGAYQSIRMAVWKDWFTRSNMDRPAF
jgi:beta-barrel assembly-enhancing protease